MKPKMFDSADIDKQLPLVESGKTFPPDERLADFSTQTLIKEIASRCTGGSFIFFAADKPPSIDTLCIIGAAGDVQYWLASLYALNERVFSLLSQRDLLPPDMIKEIMGTLKSAAGNS